jgi:hypothetical protein
MKPNYHGVTGLPMTTRYQDIGTNGTKAYVLVATEYDFPNKKTIANKNKMDGT